MESNMRSKLVLLKVFPAFLEAMDTHWKGKGFKNRTAYIRHLISKDIKWKWPA